MSNLASLWAEVEGCFRLILAAGSTDARRQAEGRLQELESVSEFPLVLVQAIASANVDGQARVMACTVLRQHVKAHWTAQAENFKEPETSPEVKVLVRQSIPMVLHDPAKQIRTNAAAVVSSIAQWDWPEQWGELTAFLLDCIGPGVATSSVDGALRVFAELTSDLPDTQLPHLVPLLLPHALRLVAAPPEGLGASSVARAIGVFTDCVSMAVNTERPDLVQPHFSSWLPVLAQPIQSPAARYCVRSKALNAAAEVMGSFAKATRDLLDTHILPAVWAALTGSVEGYVRTAVNGSGEEEALDSDGMGDDIRDLVYALFDFVGKMVGKETLRAALGPSLSQLVLQVIAYMQVTQTQLEGWQDDVNKFVADEDDEGVGYSVRLSGVDLLQGLAEAMPQPTLQATFAAARHYLQQGALACATGDPNWWKVCEVALLALGHVNNAAQEDMGGELNTLLRMLYTEHLSAAGSPFLQGRALWLASRYTKFLDSTLLADYLAAAVSALQQQHPIPVRILGLRSMHCFLSRLDAGTVQPYIQCVFDSLGSFVRQASEDLLVLLLEVATMAVKVDPQLTAANEAKLSPLALAVWIQYLNDHLVVAAVEDYIMALAQTPCLPALTARALPTILSILKAPAGSMASGTVASATELLRTLVGATAPGPLPAGLVDSALPTLIATLLRTDDHEVMQNGCEALTEYLKKGADQLIASNQVEGIVDVVAKVLAAEEDPAAVFVGGLVSKMLRKVSLGPVVQPLLQAVLARLHRASMLSLEQSLVAVYGQLMLLDLPQTIALLEGTTVAGRSGLEVLMEKWTDSQPSFHGRYDVNCTIMALCRLLDSGHPILNTMETRGQRLVTAAERDVICTRSKAKVVQPQYTKVPLGLKIFQLLAGELLQQCQKEEEGDWEDEGDSDEGEALDVQRDNHALLSDMLAGGALEDYDADAETDPELLNDPVYCLDTKDFLRKHLKELRSRDPSLFASGLRTLGPADQEALVALLE